MKLGIAICGEKVPTPSEATKEFYKQGIKTVELGYNEKFTSQEIKRIKNFDLDLSIHCPSQNLRLEFSVIRFFLNNPKFYFPKPQIKYIEKGFAIAEKLEATHYVMHGGVFPKGYFRFKSLRKRDKIVKSFIKSFQPLFLKSKDNGIKIVLENLTRGNLFSDISEIIAVKNKCPWLGFCLDFAHSELTNQTDLLKDLKIDHVHVSDNNLVNDSHIALGTGKMDFTKLKKILKEQKFNGKVLAECPHIKDAINSFKYLERYFK